MGNNYTIGDPPFECRYCGLWVQGIHACNPISGTSAWPEYTRKVTVSDNIWVDYAETRKAEALERIADSLEKIEKRLKKLSK